MKREQKRPRPGREVGRAWWEPLAGLIGIEGCRLGLGLRLRLGDEPLPARRRGDWDWGWGTQRCFDHAWSWHVHDGAAVAHDHAVAAWDFAAARLGPATAKPPGQPMLRQVHAADDQGQAGHPGQRLPALADHTMFL